MSMKVIDGKIILEGEVAKKFNDLARTPNIITIRKREKYLTEIDTTINVEKRNNGVRITLK